MKHILDKPALSGHHRPETLEFHRSAIGRAIQLMRPNPGATLDWNALSEIACMSRYHFLRIFEELTGKSPHRFLITLRMERAKQLLMETTMDVNDVCQNVGYSSAGTFIRVFKELVGIAPGAFRSLAQQLTQHRWELLVSKYMNGQNRSYPGDTFSANFRVPDLFTGNIFVGLFNPQLQPWPLVAGTLVREGVSPHLPAGGANKEAYLLAVGFPEAVDVSQYFLPNQHSPTAMAPAIPISTGDLSEPKSVSLNLRLPSIFDLPVLVCVPQLLLKLAEAKYPG